MLKINKKEWDAQRAEELEEEFFAVSVDHRGYFTDNQIKPLFAEDASPTSIWVDRFDGCWDRTYFDDIITATEYIGIFDHGKLVTGNVPAR